MQNTVIFIRIYIHIYNHRVMRYFVLRIVHSDSRYSLLERSTIINMDIE